MLSECEQASSQLFKTPKLFDNGQVFLILERFFDDIHSFWICTRIYACKHVKPRFSSFMSRSSLNLGGSSPYSNRIPSVNFFSKLICRKWSFSIFLWFSAWFWSDRLVTRGYGYGAEPTFLYYGEYKVVEYSRFSVENVLNVKSKNSDFQNIQKIWKRLSIEKVTKDLVFDFRIQNFHVTFTMYTIHGYPCMVYMVHAW